MSEQIHTLDLPALDGANPLGFLAALGSLAVLSEPDPQIKLGWHARARWLPFLTSSKPFNESEVLQLLAARLRGNVVDENAEAKRSVSQKRFDEAKKKLKIALGDLKALKLKGNQLKAERQRIVIPVERRLDRRWEIVLGRLKRAVPSAELALGQRPDCTIEEFRQHARSFRADSNPSGRAVVNLLASFGAEMSNDADERITVTPFCFITGSGHQWFLDTARGLMARATESKVREALFQPWAYADEKLTMRWDPIDDRRYALMDRDPTASDNKSTTVWMANLLAYFALGFFPSAPVQRGSATAGWLLGRDEQAFRWPVWTKPMGADAIRSILCHRVMAARVCEADRKALRARGIEAIFCAQRIQVGNPPLHKINFSQASAQ